ncbi:DUF1128 domain-containing protein [Thermoflavimicrobium dichotomicum]|uniref:Uncharacterized protein YfkK, UPF0435 family n=1 Tax=Thermoflavimicrobium dichotomicum TaxID=46223 RepID=A0A1I3RLQ7_9BACL|nr:DUF1128 family protein [Thermoflavimicrobium dichotomicum]SFJ47255.1 Uncharacterized protein YfkK, UPF0435 family [Thermoflavimicrobium dichotomicum]
MNLDTATQANLNYIVNEIKTSLKIVNAALINPEDFRLSDYDSLLEIYQLIQKKQGRLTMMEIEGILEELGELRKANK